MGLGLAICRRIIEDHGAKLTAYSDGKSGARFQITLPVGSKTADNDQAAKSYRLLVRKGFRDFIYVYVGYNPSGESSIAGEDGPGYSQGCPASALVRQN